MHILAGNVGLSICPPLWSRLKYLNSYLTDSDVICKSDLDDPLANPSSATKRLIFLVFRVNPEDFGDPP